METRVAFTRGTASAVVLIGYALLSGCASKHLTRVIPKNHRPSAETCDSVRPPSSPPGGSFDPGSAPCQSDTDCTDGQNGRCSPIRAGIVTCTYDTCFAD